MATVTTRISPLWHGLPLLSSLAELRCVGPSTYEQARRHAGREACPSVVIMDGQSVKTTERGGARGFDAHKRVKGRKRHILVDTLGLPVANRVEPAKRKYGKPVSDCSFIGVAFSLGSCTSEEVVRQPTP